MEKINGIYLEKINDELYLVKEWHEEKEMFYVASYSADELEMFFNIKREDL